MKHTFLCIILDEIVIVNEGHPLYRNGSDENILVVRLNFD